MYKLFIYYVTFARIHFFFQYQSKKLQHLGTYVYKKHKTLIKMN